MYSNPPFSQAMSAPTMSTPQSKQFNSTMTPPNQPSPYGTPQNQNRQPQQPADLSSQQTSQPSQTTPQSAPKVNPQTPVSPGVASREQEKVTLLLDLNSQLLQEIIKLQKENKGGPIGQAMPQKEEDVSGKPNVPAKEFLEYVFHCSPKILLTMSIQLHAMSPVQSCLSGSAQPEQAGICAQRPCHHGPTPGRACLNTRNL